MLKETIIHGSSPVYAFLILETWKPWVKGVTVPLPLGENILKDVLRKSGRQQNLPIGRGRETPGDTLVVELDDSHWLQDSKKIKPG